MNLLYVVIIIPLLSFLLLFVAKGYWDKGNILVVGVSGILLICVITLFVCVDFFTNTKADISLIYTRYLWQWFSVGRFKIPITLLLDSISLVFLVIISVMGLIIYSYNAIASKRNETYLFFAYGYLFLVSILLVILVDNFFVLLLGWEGLSICSYLLVGFYTKNIRSNFSAVRAFIVMHTGDIFLLTGIGLLYTELGTVNIRQAITLATDRLAVDSEIIYWITLFIFLGAIGKSAQLPLQSWLTDTTSAPMPVITLIHTMASILAGVYLIIRLSGLFILSNDILWFIGVIASLTLLFSACSALVQNNIKRITTHLSLSQLSYVFLGISVGAWNEALAYLINYIAFVSLLFLTSCSLINLHHQERNIHKMATRIRQYPFLYFCFLVAAASVSMLPWVTPSFYTKGNVLWALAAQGRLGFDAIGLVGILLCTMAVFRMVFTIFRSNRRIAKAQKLPKHFRLAYLPLSLLVILSFCFYHIMPIPTIGLLPQLVFVKKGLFSFQLLLTGIAILGILIAYVLFAMKNNEIDEIASTPIGKMLYRLWASDWRIDRLYGILFIRPYLYLARHLQRDPLMQWMNCIPGSLTKINSWLGQIENGRLQWYIASIVVGAVGIFLLLVFL